MTEAHLESELTTAAVLAAYARIHRLQAHVSVRVLTPEVRALLLNRFEQQGTPTEKISEVEGLIAAAQQHIGIDITGMGTGVAQLVRQFFPGVTTFSYSPEIKTRLVLKAYDVIHAGRLEFDASCSDLAQSLMAITRTTTASGRQLTFTAGRNQRTGHADLAWALFHALHNEPLEGQSARNTGFMEIS